ncbi:bacillithiol biosynthesis cysteine-adding enzyme BshC [Bacillus sp. 2205SS5-2]|uniref:bacillithiol biosynthesis cysteine-adding enzyme BshC n=1 Tax=Bacillus sp. 2205SS5-2 TaxID=3109031 RepID=UPI003004CA31
MELEKFSIPATNRFASLYLHQEKPVTDYFHYDLSQSSLYEQRVKDLEMRDFQRRKLAKCIEDYMNPFPSSEKVNDSLRKLKTNGVVVIGGQQAGLLTGPLYSIHKIISIIVLAKQQEQALNVPVIPVFWIAGEDHDYQEINHVFAFDEGKSFKLSYPESNLEKQMVSSLEFDKDKMSNWIRSVFEHFGETFYTNDLLKFIEVAIESTTSIVDLFSYIVMELFKDEGLLIIDSANPSLREIEAPFFRQLLEKHSAITGKLLLQQTQIQDDGFQPMIEASKQSMNLFVQHKGERLLLEMTPNGGVGKNTQINWSMDQLRLLLEESPHMFSNNVVTRPLMQEWLFPTLAFIAGPGEIAYWGELKKSFEEMDLKMPPIVPRQNITFVEREIQQLLRELDKEADLVIRDGLKKDKAAFIGSIKDEELQTYLDQTKQFLAQQYENITLRAETIEKGLIPLVEKNLAIHLNQLHFLENKIEKSILFREKVVLDKYDRITAALLPEDAPQERVWNVFYFLNKYGESFVTDLLDLPYTWDGTHNLIHV